MCTGTTWVCGCDMQVRCAVDRVLGYEVGITYHCLCYLDQYSVMTLTHTSLSFSDGSGVFGFHGVRDQSYDACCWVLMVIQCGRDSGCCWLLMLLLLSLYRIFQDLLLLVTSLETIAQYLS